MGWLARILVLLVTLGLGAAPPVVKVGVDFDYYPFEFRDAAGQVDGFSIDLLEAIAREERVRFVYEADTWVIVRRRLMAGELDMLSGMFRSKEREKVLAFSAPHLRVDYALFVRRGSGSPDTLEGMGNRPVLVQDGTHPYEWMKAQGNHGYPVPVETERQALAWLAQGQAAGAVVTQVGGLALVRELRITNLSSSPIPPLGLDYCFATAPVRQELLALLNRGLAKVRANGEYDRIHRKWFGLQGPPVPTPAGRAVAWHRLLAFGLGGGSLALAAGLFLLYRARTRRRAGS